MIRVIVGKSFFWGGERSRGNYLTSELSKINIFSFLSSFVTCRLRNKIVP